MTQSSCFLEGTIIPFKAELVSVPELKPAHQDMPAESVHTVLFDNTASPSLPIFWCRLGSVCIPTSIALLVPMH